MTKNGVSKAVRRRVFDRDGWRCRYCGGLDALVPAGHSGRYIEGGWSVDHVIPRSRGGSDKTSNLVTCCHPCNMRKGNRTPEQAGMTLIPLAKVREVHPHKVTSLNDALYSYRPQRSDWR